MSRQKTKKFAQNRLRTNIIEVGKPLFEKIKGRWNSDYFLNTNPISIELACGRGEYTVGMAELFPKQNFVGVDLKGDRLWKGSGIAEELKLNNAAFLRIQIQQIENYFEKEEVNEIWIIFPDPRPKAKDERLRLTHHRFLNYYKAVIAAEGWMRLKTDNTDFYEYTLEVLKSRDDIRDLSFTNDLYASEFKAECFDIVTKYELMFHSDDNKIKYLKFRFL